MIYRLTARGRLELLLAFNGLLAPGVAALQRFGDEMKRAAPILTSFARELRPLRRRSRGMRRHVRLEKARARRRA